MTNYNLEVLLRDAQKLLASRFLWESETAEYRHQLVGHLLPIHLYRHRLRFNSYGEGKLDYVARHNIGIARDLVRQADEERSETALISLISTLRYLRVDCCQTLSFDSERDLPAGEEGQKLRESWRQLQTPSPGPADGMGGHIGVWGAIVGDILGSKYEFRGYKTDNPEKMKLRMLGRRPTDDSYLTIATMGAMTGRDDLNSLLLAYRNTTRAYPKGCYGNRFLAWAKSDSLEPYGSYGNGSAMRVSPAGWAGDTLEEVTRLARWTAEVTHNHPEGIRGAEATAAAVFWARTGRAKTEIRASLEETFGYDLGTSLADIRPQYGFDETCAGTVPVALRAFLESNDFFHAIQLALSMGGDADTLACITGAVAGAFYDHIPPEVLKACRRRLPEELDEIVDYFQRLC